jgi:MarR family transcriptional regulator, organic hydroperoxide resistance regulator
VLALQRAAHATVHLLGADLASLGLTGSEINALANLADGQSRSVSELAAAAGARPSTLTSVLDRLERRGYISRGTRAGDRRSVLIQLTPAGSEAAREAAAAIAGLEHRALAGLPGTAVAGFLAVLHALTEVTEHEPA